MTEGWRYADNAMVMTHQAYSPRVGVPRIFNLLADYSLKATYFVPGLTAGRYPGPVERIGEDELDRMRHDECHFMLACNPFLPGRPGRGENLRGLIEHVLGLGDVEILSAGEIARRASEDPALPRHEPSPVRVNSEIYPDA